MCVPALDDPPLTVGEEESALKKAEAADGIVEKDCHESKTPTAEEANVIIIIIMDIYIYIYLERERERERESVE